MIIHYLEHFQEQWQKGKKIYILKNNDRRVDLSDDESDASSASGWGDDSD